MTPDQPSIPAPPLPAAPLTAVIFDIGGTLVDLAPPGTAVADLQPSYRPGARRLLRVLAAAGVRLAAVTDTSVMGESEVRSALGEDVSSLFEVVITSVEVGARKPDPAGVQRALALLGIDAPEALMIGDQPADEGAAAAAGVAFLGVGMAAGAPVSSSVPNTSSNWMPDREARLDIAVLEHLAARFGPLAAALLLAGPLDESAAADARALQGRLTKPPGSLGRLEELGTQLAAIAGMSPPPVPTPAAVTIFAGDHGVWAQGVSPWPQEVTAQMVANFCAGGAAINVLAAAAGAAVTVVDVGVATPLLPAPSAPGGPTLLGRRVRSGTADLSEGPAMTESEASAALDVGAATAIAAVAGGARVLLTGDMGIANTTPSAALIAALTGRPAEEVTGRGTGIDDPTLARKVRLVSNAVARLGPDRGALRVLAEVGGLEHAALAGYIVAGAAAGVPVVVDGVIALSALLVAAALSPAVTGSVIAGHRSAEPGATAALEHLGLSPVLDLGLRLGEGSGAALALPVVQAASLIMSGMATFDSAGVKEA